MTWLLTGRRSSPAPGAPSELGRRSQLRPWRLGLGRRQGEYLLLGALLCCPLGCNPAEVMPRLVCEGCWMGSLRQDVLLPAQLWYCCPAAQPTAAPHGWWVCGVRCGSGSFLIQASLSWGQGRYSFRLQSWAGAGNWQVKAPSLPMSCALSFRQRMSWAMQCQSYLPWGSWTQLRRSLSGSSGTRSVYLCAASMPGELGSVPVGLRP